MNKIQRRSRTQSIQRECMINAINCIYSKLPPDDELLIYSKHVEVNYWNKLRKKVHLFGSYYVNT